MAYAQGPIIIMHNPVDATHNQDECDVLDQIEEISNALSILGQRWEVMAFRTDTNYLKDIMLSRKPQALFNLVEAVEGDGRLLYIAPAFFDHLQVPYTGSGTEALFLTTNKLLGKLWMQRCNIPTPAWLSLDGPTLEELAFPETYIIKPIGEEASVGLDATSIVTPENIEELKGSIIIRQEITKRPCFAERFIDGREFNISVLGTSQGPKILPLAEMTFNFPAHLPRIMDYRAKWVQDSFEYSNTARTFSLGPEDQTLAESLRTISQRCWEVFGLKGYARVDFRVDAQGQPFVLEVNANPCLTPGSGFPAACEQAGMHYTEMVDAILGQCIPRL